MEASSSSVKFYVLEQKLSWKQSATMMILTDFGARAVRMIWRALSDHSKLSKFIGLLILLVLLVTCGSQFNEPPNLVGEWQATYDVDDFGVHVTGVENLVLRDDGKFKQWFVDGTYHFEGDWGTWELVRLPNGAYQVHLDHARFYPRGITLAEKLASGEVGVSKYDPGLDENIGLDDYVPLNVRPVSLFSDELELLHLPVGDLDAPDYVRFRRVVR